MTTPPTTEQQELSAHDPKERRGKKIIWGLWETTPAYKCIRCLFLIGAALTGVSYWFMQDILTNPELMSKLLRYPVPQGTVLAVSADAKAILTGCAVFTAVCFVMMVVVRWRKI
ncbi:MAG: hypothetical protein VB100_03045 [Angelakisella sp.]|nr:hypothetical protein [Angelakisella sp.]